MCQPAADGDMETQG